MKRFIIAVLCLIFILSGCTMKEVYELSYTEGRVLTCNNDTLMLIADSSPIILNVEDLKDTDKYLDGDLIRVWHDGVEETYPARTKAYKIKLLKKGSITDIDENVVRSLCEMGWIGYDDMVERYIKAGRIVDCDIPYENVTCKYIYCDMSLDIPEDWTYEVKESDDECYIRFRPDDEKEGWVVLECFSTLFAVCGTGLETKETEIGGYSASIGYYDNSGIFDFIRFTDTSGEFVVRNCDNKGWFFDHEDEIISILNTVVLSPEQLSVDEVSVIADQIMGEYEDRYIWFNCFSGEWIIDVYKDNVRYNFKLNTKGEIITHPQKIK